MPKKHVTSRVFEHTELGSPLTLDPPCPMFPWSNANRRCSNRSSCDVVGLFLPWRSCFLLPPGCGWQGAFLLFFWLTMYTSIQQLTRNLWSDFYWLGWCNAMCACIYIIHRRWRAQFWAENLTAYLPETECLEVVWGDGTSEPWIWRLKSID